MKRLIQQLAHTCGYHVSPLSVSNDARNPFEEMRSLFGDVPDPVIFDVGAHHGLVTKEFRRLFPDATIFAFEPFPESFEELERNTQSDPRIRAFNFGLSDKSGVLDFHSNASAYTNSLLPTEKAGAETWGPGILETRETVRANFKTLDEVVAEHGLAEIHVLKLDVQGAEDLVMQGAADSCARGRVKLVYTEIITQPTYQGQPRFDRALAGFYDRGFDLHNIYNMNSTADGRLRQVDVIFARTPPI